MKYLSVCAILKNEGLYLKEWIDFHIKQGVEHFYLYDNESDDSPREVLKAYEEIITWKKVYGTQQQRVAYNEVVNLYTFDTEWCAFIDIDEFLYSLHTEKFVDTLRRRYDEPAVSGIAVHWLLFGSNGHQSYSADPVTQRFTRRGDAVNQHVKSVMRLNQTLSMGNDPHSFRVTGNVIDEHHRVLPLNYALHQPATADVLRINHYHTKSYEEYFKRKSQPDANTGVVKDPHITFPAHDKNEVEDLEILKLV